MKIDQCRSQNIDGRILCMMKPIKNVSAQLGAERRNSEEATAWRLDLTLAAHNFGHFVQLNRWSTSPLKAGATRVSYWYLERSVLDAIRKSKFSCEAELIIPRHVPGGRNLDHTATHRQTGDRTIQARRCSIRYHFRWSSFRPVSHGCRRIAFAPTMPVAPESTAEKI